MSLEEAAKNLMALDEFLTDDAHTLRWFHPWVLENWLTAEKIEDLLESGSLRRVGDDDGWCYELELAGPQ